MKHGKHGKLHKIMILNKNCYSCCKMRKDIYYKDENQMCNKKKKGNYDTMK